MLLWTHDRWRFPLPERHRFPIDKYALLRERVVADGTVAAADVVEPPPVPWAWIEAVHDGALVARIRDGELTLREARGLGLPWSPEPPSSRLESWARRKNSGASCSQVAPIPPCTEICARVAWSSASPATSRNAAAASGSSSGRSAAAQPA